MTTTPDKSLAEKLAKDPAFQDHLVQQLLSSLWCPGGTSQERRKAMIESALERLVDIEPRGAIEGMLAVQMIATHEAATECLRRAMLENQPSEVRDANLKNAAKLMSTYERQVAALDRHRGKGQQSVTVKYVHIAEGAQAIVGTVSAGGKRRPAEKPPAIDARKDPFEILSTKVDMPEPAALNGQADIPNAIARRGRRA